MTYGNFQTRTPLKAIAFNLSDQGYVIDNGVIRYHGSINDLRDNEEVRKKYLLV